MYIFLGDFSFDFSNGEYRNSTVENVFIGSGDFDNDELAYIEGKMKYDEYIEHNGEINMYESYFHIKKL